MSNRYVIEALLRPAVELNTAVVAATAAGVCVTAPWAVALAPSVSYATAAGFGVLAAVRFRQGMKVIRYRRNLRRLTRYVMSTRQIPVSRQRLFLGRGFRWTQKHTQRLQDTLRPEVARYLQPGWLYRMARQLELKTEHTVPRLGALLRQDSPLNPVRPLPPVGGNPALHGIEPDEQDVTLALGERVGHTIVYGTTRVGKTRLAELLVTQDIRRGEVTIVFDPKGDADLLLRVWAEAPGPAGAMSFISFIWAGRKSLPAIMQWGVLAGYRKWPPVWRGSCPVKATVLLSGSLPGVLSISLPAPWWRWENARITR